MPVVGHGKAPVPDVTMDGWICSVISGSGLSPPVDNSVAPSGMPIRPTLDRAPMPGDEADPAGLADAVAPLAHVPEAVPAMPAPSNSGVGADVPEITPVAEVSPLITLLVPVVELPMVELPIVEFPRPAPEQAVVDIMAPCASGLMAPGLTPGVASSVAPSGIPVVPTDAAGPIPSGEVMPSGGGTAPIVTCAEAAAHPSSEKVIAAIRQLFTNVLRLDGARSEAMIVRMVGSRRNATKNEFTLD